MLVTAWMDSVFIYISIPTGSAEISALVIMRERESKQSFCSMAHHCVLAQEFLAAPDAITQESGM